MVFFIFKQKLYPLCLFLASVAMEKCSAPCSLWRLFMYLNPDTMFFLSFFPSDSTTQILLSWLYITVLFLLHSFEPILIRQYPSGFTSLTNKSDSLISSTSHFIGEYHRQKNKICITSSFDLYLKKHLSPRPLFFDEVRHIENYLLLNQITTNLSSSCLWWMALSLPNIRSWRYSRLNWTPHNLALAHSNAKENTHHSK